MQKKKQKNTVFSFPTTLSNEERERTKKKNAPFTAR
jgi:hypothetical protein